MTNIRVDNTYIFDKILYYRIPPYITEFIISSLPILSVINSIITDYPIIGKNVLVASGLIVYIKYIINHILPLKKHSIYDLYEDIKDQKNCI